MNLTKYISVLGVLLVVAAALGLFFVKGTVEAAADSKLAGYQENITEVNTRPEILMNATRYVYMNSKEAGNAQSPWFLGAANIITADYIPAALRTPAAALALAYPKNKEEGANDLLAQILEKHDLEVQRWDIVSPHATKNTVVVKTSESSYKYLDPVDGVIAMYENRVMVGPYAARSFVSEGTDYREIFLKLDESADLSFYKDFGDVMFAPPGFPLYINVAAPVLDEPLEFGQIDGKSEDVSDATAEWDLTRNFSYLENRLASPSYKDARNSIPTSSAL